MTARKGATRRWVQFSYKGADYDRPGPELVKHWARLHRGDAERLPDAKRVAALYGRAGAARDAVAIEADDADLAVGVQEAWRAFHRGDFEAAWHGGRALGPLGVSPAVKSAGVYATYLAENGAAAERLLREAVALAESAAKACPDYANAHYFHAFALGRYSQRISVLKAIAAGHAGRVRASLDRALQLEPRHADAHLALGLYHAEIVGKVGGIAAKVTYGASAAAAEKHFEKALALFPESPIARVEYANGLLAMHGDRAQDRAASLYEEAAACRPEDAMERLDVEQARAELG
ncbi:MAG: hypothetical protein O9284_15340 [Steroidobacteraceae bacterium]|jgi:tetratricopeptide (TPR) repeat protein|nr:hypothetical protein [Steroidobacteraceae bacterium]